MPVLKIFWLRMRKLFNCWCFSWIQPHSCCIYNIAQVLNSCHCEHTFLCIQLHSSQTLYECVPGVHQNFWNIWWCHVDKSEVSPVQISENSLGCLRCSLQAKWHNVEFKMFLVAHKYSFGFMLFFNGYLVWALRHIQVVNMVALPRATKLSSVLGKTVSNRHVIHDLLM